MGRCVTLLSPPRDTNLPVRYRELVLAEEPGCGGYASNLLLGSTGPTLESLVIRNTFNSGDRSFSHLVRVSIPDHDEIPSDSKMTLENCRTLRRLKTKAPCYGILAYVDDQARLIRTIASPFLGQIVFLGELPESDGQDHRLARTREVGHGR